VATHANQQAKLDHIHQVANKNGVRDLKWLTAEEAKDMEPEVICTKVRKEGGGGEGEGEEGGGSRSSSSNSSS